MADGIREAGPDEDDDEPDLDDGLTAPAWAVAAAADLAGLPLDVFGAWQREAGIPELAVLLLFRWDPDDVRLAYPESSETYAGVAHSLILGRRMGDTRRASATRLRKQGSGVAKDERPDLFDDGRLHELLDEVDAWLPLSLARWWRRATGLRLRSLPFHCHVLNYDASRARHGYDDGTWTSYADIGSSFDGEVLTRETYERVEQAHLDVVAAMVRETGATAFVPLLEPFHDRPLDLPGLIEQVRAALREEGDERWWRAADDSMYVDVGYDFHLHVGSRTPCSDGVRLAEGRGLHPRLDGPSPSLYLE